MDFSRFNDLFLSEHQAQQMQLHLDNPYSTGPTLQQAIVTDLRDFLTIAQAMELERGKSLVDIGSGWGRSKIFLETLFPQAQVYAIESHKGRHQKALQLSRQFGIEPSRFIHASVGEFPIPRASAYYLYFPIGPALYLLMDQLREFARKKGFTLFAVESHGDLIPTLFQYPWLCLRKKHTLHSPRLGGWIYEFQCVPGRGQKKLKTVDVLSPLSFLESFSQWWHKKEELIVQDHHGLWLASLQGLQLQLPEKIIQSQYPPRTFNLNQIKGTTRALNFKTWLDRRDKDWEHPSYGKIRKIYLAPEEIEFSSGAIIKPENIKGFFKN